MKGQREAPISFLVVTVIASWLIWAPGILSSQFSVAWLKKLELPLVMIGGCVPSIIGIVFIKLERRKGIFKVLFNPSIGLIWIPIVLIIPLAGLMAEAAGIALANGGKLEIGSISEIPLLFAMFLFLGPINEEIGWRGYGLRKLQKSSSPLVSSIVIGLAWVLWHIPLFFIDDAPQSKLPFAPFAETLILSSILITYFQNKAGQSIWPAIILHNMINLTNEVFPLYRNGDYRIWNYANIILLLIAVVLVMSGKRDMLKRGSLPPPSAQAG